VSSNLLITPGELSDRLGDAGLKVVDVRAGEHYANGHIPGAQHFSVYGLNTYDTDDAPLRSFVHSWAFLLGRCGLSADEDVVIYEDLSGMSAARAVWFLEYLGHGGEVRMLDGGLAAWRAEGHPIIQDATSAPQVNYAYRLDASRVATRRDMLAAIGADDRLILDTRSDEEWFATRATARRNGTLPGARHLEWTENLTSEGRFKSIDALRELYLARGVSPDKEVLAFCNTGYRSAHAYVAMRLMDYPRVRNYVGSWQEWGNRADTPIVEPDDPLVAPLSDDDERRDP
jgi:thiosulfate/3-mercaptopyruvate sulfurtransferase